MVHSLRHLGFVELHDECRLGNHCVALHNRSVVDDGISEQASLQRCGTAQSGFYHVIVHHVEHHRAAFVLCFGKFVFLVLAVGIGYLDVFGIAVSRYFKHSASGFVGLNVGNLLLFLVEQCSAQLSAEAFLVSHHKSDSACESLHPVASFRIELHTLEIQCGG